jgi:hypothetical protein
MRSVHATGPDMICPGNFDRSFRTARHYTKACFRHNLAGVTCSFFPVA